MQLTRVIKFSSPYPVTCSVHDRFTSGFLYGGLVTINGSTASTDSCDGSDTTALCFPEAGSGAAIENISALVRRTGKRTINPGSPIGRKPAATEMNTTWVRGVDSTAVRIALTMNRK